MKTLVILYDNTAIINKATMKLNILLILSTITLFTSCNGQTSNQKKSTDQLIKSAKMIKFEKAPLPFWKTLAVIL